MEFENLKDKIDTICRQLCFEYDANAISLPEDVIESVAEEFVSLHGRDAVPDKSKVIKGLLNFLGDSV